MHQGGTREAPRSHGGCAQRSAVAPGIHQGGTQMKMHQGGPNIDPTSIENLSNIHEYTDRASTEQISNIH